MTRLVASVTAILMFVQSVSIACAGHYDCVVKIIGSDGHGSSYQGAGMVVSRNGWIFTAAHVVDHETVSVITCDGSRYAVVDKIRSGPGERVIAVKVNATLTPIVIAKSAPIPGQMVATAGYPGGKFNTFRTRVENTRLKYLDGDIDLISVRVPFKDGHSGGGVWNTQGELLGIVTSSDNRNGKFFHTKYLLPLLKDCRDKSSGMDVQLPKLYVFTDPSYCNPCKKFESDYRANITLRNWLNNRWRVTPVSPTGTIAREYGVTSMPTFIVEGKKESRVEGYEGPNWLMSKLGAAPSPPVDSSWSSVDEPDDAPMPEKSDPPVRYDQAKPSVDAPEPPEEGKADPVVVESAHRSEDEPEVSLPPIPEQPANVPPMPVIPQATVPATAVTDAVVDAAPGIIETVLPLLPWTLGPAGGVAGTVGIYALRALLKRRRERRAREEVAGDDPGIPRGAETSRLPSRDHTETRQLLNLGQLEERDTLSDSLRWMLIEDEAYHAESEGTEKALVESVHRVNRRLEEIAPLQVRQEAV